MIFATVTSFYAEFHAVKFCSIYVFDSFVSLFFFL